MDAAPHDELRPVTAMFADIVGSTALGERLAPDEVKVLIGECVNRMSAAAEELGGFVQAYAGDGICVLFGVPVAHEDDPERAALAALRIIDRVREYGGEIASAWSITDFNVRIGVNTGTAAVGMVGAGSHHPVALGDTTNVAARLQAAAEPGTILVGKATARRLAVRFRLESVGAITMKGKASPVEAWRLIGTDSGSGSQPQPQLMNRVTEMAVLDRVLKELESGRGQAVIILGTAGIGKSRLIDEAAARAGDRSVWLAGACPPHGGSLPYAPFAGMLRAWLDLPTGAADIVVRTRARARLGGTLGLAVDQVAALEALLGAAATKDATHDVRAACRAWIDALAGSHPVAVAVDDVQLCDPATAELIEDLVGSAEQLPVTVMVAMRPDPDSAGWALRSRLLGEHSHRTSELALGPLDDEASTALAAAFAPLGLDDEQRRVVVGHSEGNPLYLAEILRSVIESGGDVRERSWTVTVSAEVLPPALESLLVARIDRLPASARRLAQAAAVLGRTFPVPALQRLHPDDLWADDLAILMRAEIVRELQRYPMFECVFTESLLQEAALATLTPARRRELAGLAASGFHDALGPAADERLEVLANYCVWAGDLAQAQQVLGQAADRAAALGAADVAAEMRRRAAKVDAHRRAR